MSIIMKIPIDSMLLFLSLISICVDCESDHNFDLFIDSNPTSNFGNNDPGAPCEQKGCTKIQFSLPDVKFWEVWKEDNKDVDRSDTEVTHSNHWPHPPAIWGESVMGQQSINSPPTRHPYSPNFDKKLPNGPIITKLDKIVDILRPMSDQNQDNWLDFGLKRMDQKPESRYDSSDNYYDYEVEPTDDQYFNDKNIVKRNLKKFIIEENDDKQIRPEVIIKKRQKKPTIYIEEELVPIEKPKKEVVYKIVKKPKPKTQHIIIEDEDNEEPEEVEEEVVYQKKPTKKDKMKEIYILSNGDVLSDNQQFIDQRVVTRPPTTTTTTTRAPTTTRVTTTTTMRPIRRQKKRKTFVETDDNNELEERVISRDGDYYEEDYEDEDGQPPYDEDEEAWGSATPQTRVKPSRSRKQSNLNPFSVLRRLRPRYPPPHPQPYPQPYPPPYPQPYAHPPPPVQHQGHKGGMVPGGTFRMRFYMDGPKNKESDDDSDSE